MELLLRFKSAEKEVVLAADVEMGMVLYSAGNEKAIKNYCGLMNKLTADFNEELSK